MARLYDFEFQFRRRDGEIRTAQESSFATRDESGAVVAYQGFLLDVTERKQAEIEIRRRNRALLALNAYQRIARPVSALDEGLTAALLKVTELSPWTQRRLLPRESSRSAASVRRPSAIESEYGRRVVPSRFRGTA